MGSEILPFLSRLEPDLIMKIGKECGKVFCNAAWNYDAETMDFLINHGIDVNVTGPSHVEFVVKSIEMSALSITLHNSFFIYARRLLDYGASVNGGGGSFPPLHSLLLAPDRTDLTCMGKDDRLSMIEALISRGADVNQPWEGTVPIQLAAIYSSEEVVQALLNAGADINSHTQGGEWCLSAIAFAFDYGRDSMVDILIKAVDSLDRVDILKYALERKNYVVVEKMIKAGVDVKRGDTLKYILMENSAEMKIRRELLERLRKYCFDIEREDELRDYLMKNAYRMDRNDRIIQMLIKAGADITKEGLLDDALRSGSHHIVEILIKAGVDVTRGEPLKCALLGQNDDLIELVLDTFPDHGKSTGCVAICIEERGIDQVKEYIRRGIFDDTDLDNDQLITAIFESCNETLINYCLTKMSISKISGTSGLIAATRKRNLNVVQMFLNAGIRPYWELPNTHENTAFTELFPTTYWRAKEVLELLLSGCRSESATSTGGQKPWREGALAFMKEEFSSFMRDISPPMFKSLWESGILLHIDEPLKVAIEINRLNIVYFLVEKGADIHYPACVVQRLDGRKQIKWTAIHTSLQYAARVRSTQLLELLLQKGADVNAEPAEVAGATALQFACFHNHFQSVSILMEAGADINAPPAIANGRAAIEGAAEFGRLDMVKFLLEAGADVQGRHNPTYRRTIYLACKENHWVIANMVQDFKRDRFGPEDVEPLKNILTSMTDEDVKFLNEEAKIKWKFGQFEPVPKEGEGEQGSAKVR